MRLFAGALVGLALGSGAALAQSTTESTTTRRYDAAPAPLVAPPDGTLSTTRTSRSVDANGNRTESEASTYRNGNGVAEDSRTVTTTVPPPPPVTSTTSSSTTVIERR